MLEQNGLNVAGTHEPPLVHWKTWAAAVSDAENRPGAGSILGCRGGPYGSRNRTARKRAQSWTLVECPAPVRMQCRGRIGPNSLRIHKNAALRLTLCTAGGCLADRLDCIRATNGEGSQGARQLGP